MIDVKLLKAIIKGFITFIPGVARLLKIKYTKSKHSTYNAEFCYTLWLSLLVYLRENGINSKLDRIGEIGNGSSIGVGLCALLTGSKEYYALENDNLFDKENNLKLLDELVVLLKKMTPISSEFKQLNIKISNYNYPENLIKPFFLQESFVTAIRKDISNHCHGSEKIKIYQKWETLSPMNLDFIFSRAVMEHVRYPGEVYKGIYSHLKGNSYMFHDIELHSHGVTKSVNGHYSIHNKLWTIIYGKRDHYMNRWDIDKHLGSIIENEFEVVLVQNTHILLGPSKERFLFGATILAQKLARII